MDVSPCACGMSSQKIGFLNYAVNHLSHRSMCAQAERKVIVISKSVFIVFGLAKTYSLPFEIHDKIVVSVWFKFK